MKFDVFSWKEVPANEEIQHPQGWLRVRLSAPAALYLQAHGVEALAGYAAAFDLNLSEAVNFRVDGPKSLRVFVETAMPTSVEFVGERFTNTDRRPSESGSLNEVTRALRQMEIRHRQQMAEIRAAESRAPKAPKAEKPAPDPVITE